MAVEVYLDSRGQARFAGEGVLVHGEEGYLQALMHIWRMRAERPDYNCEGYFDHTESGRYVLVDDCPQDPQMLVCISCGRAIPHVGKLDNIYRDAIDRSKPINERRIDDKEYRLRDSGKTFRCQCGGNVFTKWQDDDHPEFYRCTACNRDYEGDPVDEP